MMLTIKASKKELASIQEYLNRATVVLGKQVKMPADMFIPRKIYTFKVNYFTGKVTLYLAEDFIVDLIEIFGDTIIASLLLAKNMSALKDRISEFCDKWSDDPQEILEAMDPEATKQDDPLKKQRSKKICVFHFLAGEDGTMNKYFADTEDEANQWAEGMGQSIEIFQVKDVIVDGYHNIISFLN